MLIRRFLFVFLITISSGTVVRASDDSPPADPVLVHTILCEAGRAGDYLVSHGFPAYLKVYVSWANTNVEFNSGSGNVNFTVAGGSGERSREQIKREKSRRLPFNLSQQNLSVCTGYKIDIIQEGVGVYDCLINDKIDSLRIAVDGGSGSVSCEKDVRISKKLNGDAKVSIWGVGLGAGASWGNTYDFSFYISAPTPSEEFDSK